MSLLLEALKTLADRPVPANGSNMAAPGDQATSVPTAPSASARTSQATDESLKPEASTEKLLDDAASAIAESLNEGIEALSEDKESDRLSVHAPTAEEPGIPAETASQTNWAETWQQALGIVSSDATHAKDDYAEGGQAETTREESPTDQEVTEKLSSVFAPWFEAHGLAAEPVEEESKEPESRSAESSNVVAAETGVESSRSFESASHPVADSPQAKPAPKVDPTWELYDRSVEFATPWRVEAKASTGSESTPGPEAPTTIPHSNIPPEYAPTNQQDPVVAPKAQIVENATAEHSTHKLLEKQTAKPETQQHQQSRQEAPASSVNAPLEARPQKVVSASQPAASSHSTDEIRVSEPYLRLANRLLQSLRNARPQAIVLAAADEPSSRTLDMAQFAKAITLSEEGRILIIQAHHGRPDLSRRLELIPDHHPRWQASAGSDLAERIHCSSRGRIDLLSREKLCLNSEQMVDPLLVARCKRHYPLVLLDIGMVSSEIAQGLAPQGDAAVMVAVMQNTLRETAAQSILQLRRLGVRTAGCVLLEPRSGNSAKLR